MFLVTAVVLLAAPQFPGEVQAYRFASFLGFTADGAQAAYTLWEPHHAPDVSWDRNDAVVVELATGVETRYTLAFEGFGGAPPKSNRPRKEFEAWKNDHPLSTPASTPDGGQSAIIEVRPGTVRWKAGTGHFAPDERAGSERAKLSYSVGSPPDEWVISSLQMPQSAGAYQPGRVEAFWSPDGKRVAFVTNWGWLMPENPGHGDVLFAPATGPRLELAADAKLNDAVALGSMRALDSAGIVVLRRGKAKAAREKSVVYAAKGAEDFAAKVAAAVPGGATVEPLTWKADAEVVLALGASAAKP